MIIRNGGGEKSQTEAKRESTMIYVYESGAYDYFLLAYISIFMRFSILKSYQLGQKRKTV